MLTLAVMTLALMGALALARALLTRRRLDFQGGSDEAGMQKLRDQIPGYANSGPLGTGAGGGLHAA